MTGETHRVARAAAVMMTAIFLSRVLGQLRDTAIAAWFGQNAYTDVYRAAFSIPDLLFFLIAGGALSSSFVPVFTEYLTRGQEEEAWKVFSVVATFMTLVVTGLVLIGEVFARQLVPLVAPGFASWQLDMTATLTRIVLPAQICFFLGGLMMATLYVRGHFLVPALGPIVYNLGIIAGGWLLGERLGIAALSWGALAGAIVGNLLLQMLFLRRVGVRYQPSLNLSHPGVVKVGKLVLPVILGLSLPQVFVLINRAFASLLPPGAVSALDNANKQMQAPLGIFAQAISIAIFPTLSAQAARGDMESFRRTLLLGVRTLWFLTIPVSLWMMVLSTDIVSILLQYKKFTAYDTRITAEALTFYCIGLFAFSSQAILNRAFYAVQDTVTPVVIGTLTTLIFVPLNWWLMAPLAHKGLALAGSIAAILHVMWMLYALRRKVQIPVESLWLPLVRIVLTSLVSAATGYTVRWWLVTALQSGQLHPKLVSLLAIVLVLAIGGGTYLLLSRLWRAEELDYALKAWRRRNPPQVA
ncbi:MAG: murein biosynthesis integral membrane protein MurJ [Armatimonadota bacterium]|nr:murein biosynthesis integral membrane protein MurJ [Armatimonadota bacterium]